MIASSFTKWFKGNGRRSSVRPVQKARLRLEGLECRDMPAVFGGLALGLPTLVASHPVADHVAETSVVQPMTNAIHSVAAANYQYTAITIKNSTNATVNYSFRWGNGTWTNYSLTAGQQRVHYISSLNQVATIAYDKSFAPGVQEQQYSLQGKNVVFPAGFYLVTPTPSIAQGQLYTFKGVTNGIQLYS